jgi:Aldo/keto reductase family
MAVSSEPLERTKRARTSSQQARPVKAAASELRRRSHASVALAWVLAQKPWIVPIPGTTKLHRLEENIAAAEVALTSTDLAEIENAQLEAEGARYSEANQRMIDRRASRAESWPAVLTSAFFPTRQTDPQFRNRIGICPVRPTGIRGTAVDRRESRTRKPSIRRKCAPSA